MEKCETTGRIMSVLCRHTKYTPTQRKNSFIMLLTVIDPFMVHVKLLFHKIDTKKNIINIKKIAGDKNKRSAMWRLLKLIHDMKINAIFSHFTIFCKILSLTCGLKLAYCILFMCNGVILTCWRINTSVCQHPISGGKKCIIH